ncbi:thaumatin-like protein [Moniliophthora roreri MCA 2997]|uniref:Thaumatin-like protein n=1 Tax=Moniliophthora roreri (strain MCA 2997) TaxID=1381753 RepID=V2X3M1_MONRO|nr:thaumatin-like protein [Moniliophthora roreri MCA 2997]
MWTPLLVLAAANSGASAARTLTVTNNCAYTIWPAIWTDPNASKTKPDHPGGWEAASGTSVSFSVPDEWDSWTNMGPPESCTMFVCRLYPPTTVAEFTFSASGNMDYYDVSLVDGFNLPFANH